MTGTTAGARPGQPPRDLAPRLLRALYSQSGLRTFGDLHIAVPKGTPWYVAHSVSEIVCQVSAVPHLGSDCELRGQPRCPPVGTCI